jgi:uncharacterized protein (DUF1810 family)
MSDLERFIEAQAKNYDTAFEEIKNGKKLSHWMWYIFPQINGLGFSSTSQFYAIKSLNEAQEYLKHPILGSRLINICRELLKLSIINATVIFGKPDDMKLKSSMTLFSLVKNTDPIFDLILEKFFNGKKDERTIEMINK